jgi:hypothetical protein
VGTFTSGQADRPWTHTSPHRPTDCLAVDRGAYARILNIRRLASELIPVSLLASYECTVNGPLGFLGWARASRRSCIPADCSDRKRGRRSSVQLCRYFGGAGVPAELRLGSGGRLGRRGLPQLELSSGRGQARNARRNKVISMTAAGQWSTEASVHRNASSRAPDQHRVPIMPRR